MKISKHDKYRKAHIEFLRNPMISKAIGRKYTRFMQEFDYDGEFWALVAAAYVYAVEYHSGMYSKAYALHNHLVALNFSPGCTTISSDELRSPETENPGAWELLLAIAKADGVEVDPETGEVVRDESLVPY